MLPGRQKSSPVLPPVVDRNGRVHHLEDKSHLSRWERNAGLRYLTVEGRQASRAMRVLPESFPGSEWTLRTIALPVTVPHCNTSTYPQTSSNLPSGWSCKVPIIDQPILPEP